MVINMNMQKIKKDKMTPKVNYMPVLGLRVNLYSGVVQNKMGLLKVFIKASENKRDQRARPESN